jgi:hypothetical protein
MRNLYFVVILSASGFFGQETNGECLAAYRKENLGMYPVNP